MDGSDEAYYDTDRAEMLKFLPVGAQRVLELGCGPGRFGELVKRERGVAEYWGMEYDPDVAARAAKVFDRVLVGDANEYIDELPDGHFDVIVANDVLEHLAYPWETLERLRPKLRPNGVVVASIPNVRYLPVLAKVIFGRDFPQEDAGIFDRTHLRFFTHKSMRRMFVQAGYEVQTIEGLGRQKFVWAALAVLTLGWFWDGLAMQFACVAKPRASASDSPHQVTSAERKLA
jgi:2-polyprenyl-3-methyl-5-hydroxy-6-metoxy-1,4-benzoquinol methylase